MKQLFTALAILLINSLFAQNNGDQLFQPDILHEIRIESDNPNFFDDLINEYYAGYPDDYVYLPAKVWLDGVEVDSVGVRVKGGLSAFDDKRPLKLDFNWFRPEQEFQGLKKVNLHNAYFDASMQREAISYEILRNSGLKTPRTAFTQIYINDELHGVYNIIEQIDKTFLQDYFANNDGVLYKTGDGELEIVSDQGTFTEFNHLMSVVDNFSGNALKDTLDKVLDTEAFMRNLATQNIINSTDNIITVDYNYYLYFEPKSQLLYYIPWDFNLAFFPFIDFPIDENQANQVAHKMLQTPVYQERYYELFCEILEYNFNENRLLDLVDMRYDLIKDAMQNDPRFSFTLQEFEDEQIVVKDWIVARRADLLQQLENSAFACEETLFPTDYQLITINEIVASNDSVGGVADPAGGYPDWIELYNNSEEDIDLSGYYLSDDTDFRKHWAFPKNTVIAANDYLIIWADRDLSEEGLHADFKLNKNSGELFLTYEDFTVIDSMAYEAQETNVGYARVPNGTGDFVFQEASFAGTNDLVNTAEITGENFNWNVFPNPTSDILTVTLPDEFIDKKPLISILNVYGKTLTVQNSLSFSVGDYPAGIYFVQLQLAEKTFVKRVTFVD